MENTNRYNDIKSLPHHRSATRPHMSLHDRAAQFAPFAALTGYDDMVREEARLTGREIELSETEKQRLDGKLARIGEVLAEGRSPEITVRYFVPDARKSGGCYEDHTGAVRKLDAVERKLLFQSATPQGAQKEIAIDRILEIHGETVDDMDAWII